MRRILRAGGLTIAALLATPGCTSGPAGTQAGNPAGHRSAPYAVSWTLVSRPLAACVTFTAAGSFTYTLAGGQYSGLTLASPQLTASVSSYDAATRRCAGTKVAGRLSMAQHWAGYACGFNPPVSAPSPWRARNEAWPGCHDRDQALMSTAYDTAGSRYAQYNSGSPLPLGTFRAGGGSAAPCFGVYATASLGGRGTAATFTASSYPSANKVCLPGRT